MYDPFAMKSRLSNYSILDDTLFRWCTLHFMVLVDELEKGYDDMLRKVDYVGDDHVFYGLHCVKDLHYLLK